MEITQIPIFMLWLAGFAFGFHVVEKIISLIVHFTSRSKPFENGSLSKVTVSEIKQHGIMITGLLERIAGECEQTYRSVGSMEAKQENTHERVLNTESLVQDIKAKSGLVAQRIEALHSRYNDERTNIIAVVKSLIKG